VNCFCFANLRRHEQEDEESEYDDRQSAAFLGSGDMDFLGDVMAAKAESGKQIIAS